MKRAHVFCFLTLTHFVSSANILCLYPTTSLSHFLFVEPLLMALSKSGHNVTVLSEYVRPKPIDTYHAVQLTPNKRLVEVFELFIKNSNDKLFLLKNMNQIFEVIKTSIDTVFEHRELQRIRSEGQVDLLITECAMGDALLGLLIDLNCPSVQVISLPPMLDLFKRTGNPTSLSYVPNSFLSVSGELMGFWSRVLNLIVAFMEEILINQLIAFSEIVYTNHFPPPKYPPLREMSKRVSLLITNTHFSQGIVRPLVPAIIEASGMHIEPPSPLPEDLQEFMDNSKHGVILFSLGTNVKSANLSQRNLAVLLNVFRSLRENSLWKFEHDTIESLPPNVKISKWLPQNDLLAHPNLKLFITHGGLGSIFEAKYHGVPLVLIPVYGDQLTNAEQVVADGWGVSVKFDNLSENDLAHGIHEVSSNTVYRDQAQYLSRLYHDRPLTAIDNAKYWVEYVIRHKGATHMQSNAKNLNFIQLHSLDVISFLLFCLIIVCVIMYTVLKLVIRCLAKRCSRNKFKRD